VLIICYYLIIAIKSFLVLVNCKFVSLSDRDDDGDDRLIAVGRGFTSSYTLLWLSRSCRYSCRVQRRRQTTNSRRMFRFSPS